MKKLLFSAFSVLFLISSSFLGCAKETYPKERLAQSIIELCQKEYHTQVSAKVVGETLGIYLSIEHLIGSSSGEFTFEKKALDILDDVMLSIRRVVLSTNAKVKFFTLIGVDRNLGFEFIMTRYIDDVRRVMLTNISRDDFSQRLIYKLKPSASVLGKKRIKEFFNSIGKQNIETLIQQNFVENITIKEISSPFFLNLLEIGMKEKNKTEILELKEKAISQNEILYYVKTKETFTLKEGFNENSLFYPPGFESEYIILVTIENYPAYIKKVYPLVTLNKNKEIENLDFPEEFDEYKDLSKWKEEDFYIEEAQLPDFIAFQVAQQIQSFFQSNAKKIDQPFKVSSVEAKYVEDDLANTPEGLPKRSIFELKFTLQKQKSQSEVNEKLSKPLLKISVKTLEKICKNYNFTNFSGIRVLDSEKTEILNIDKSMIKTLIGK